MSKVLKCLKCWSLQGVWSKVIVDAHTVWLKEKNMDREELMTLIRKGPVRILMNDGESYDVPNVEFTVVSDISASALYVGADGKMRMTHLPLVTMSGVEEIL